MLFRSDHYQKQVEVSWINLAMLKRKSKRISVYFGWNNLTIAMRGIIMAKLSTQHDGVFGQETNSVILLMDLVSDRTELRQ